MTDDLKTKMRAAILDKASDGWSGDACAVDVDDALEAALQAIHDAGYEILPRDDEGEFENVAEQAFCEGWRSREARPGQLIDSRAAMRAEWAESNARDLISASQPNAEEKT